MSGTGYAHPDYVASFAEWGTTRHLPASSGWLLERAIPGTDQRDAMGPYPLFCCEDWSAVGDDLADLTTDLVSVVLVADPFCPLGDDELRASFDRVVPFKEHFVTDLSTPVEQIVTTSHRAAVRRAHKRVDVDIVAEPWRRLDRWVELWSVLSVRHSITGLRAFSRSAFELQLRVPGMVMFEATVGDEIVGLDLWYVSGDVAYGHLVAFSELGYETRASYATKWAVLEHFAGDDRVRWVDLGAGAGAADADDGLARFKRGWSNATRTAHLCGRILQPDAYAQLAEGEAGASGGYFPAYRAGELT